MAHIPFGFISLILFWIPVAVQKGSPLHRKVGKLYYATMWVVAISSIFLSICNLIMGKTEAAMFLGYLSIITAYPLWYSYEILHQKKEWSNRYFIIRKIFLAVLFISALVMVYMGAFVFKFQGMGVVMVFFGVIAIPSGREFMMTKNKATIVEQKLKMHIQGTIISGIAAYTAFFAFGGSRVLMQTLQLDQRWMILAWTLPTIMGTVYSRYMKTKYG